MTYLIEMVVDERLPVKVTAHTPRMAVDIIGGAKALKLIHHINTRSLLLPTDSRLFTPVEIDPDKAVAIDMHMSQLHCTM